MLCIVGQDHQRREIVVDHSRKFKGILSKVYLRLMCYDTENEADHQFPEKRRGNNCSNLKKEKLPEKINLSLYTILSFH